MREAATSLNVIVVTFPDKNSAYQAIEAIENLDAQGHIELGEVGIIERTELGWVAPKSPEKGRSLESLTDALDVPKGLDPDSAAAAVTFIGQHIPPGSRAVVAIIAEREGELLVDGAMSRLGGSLKRRAAIDVFTELEEAMDLQERRRTFHERAEEKLRAVVQNKMREEASLLDRLEQAVSKPLERWAERQKDTEA